jgi:hypothetical protein
MTCREPRCGLPTAVDRWAVGGGGRWQYDPILFTPPVDGSEEKVDMRPMLTDPEFHRLKQVSATASDSKAARRTGMASVRDGSHSNPSRYQVSCLPRTQSVHQWAGTTKGFRMPGVPSSGATCGY